MLKRGCINGFVMVWSIAKIGRSIVTIAVSTAILLLAFGLPVAASGSQNIGQNNPSVTNGTTVIANITVGKGPTGIAYNPSNGYIYVANSFSGTVSVIDGATNKVIANITVGVGPRGIAYNPSNGYIYVTNSGSGTVSVISKSASTSSTSISSVTAPAAPTTSTSTEPTPSAVPAWAAAAIVVAAVLIAALLMIKRRRPQL